MGVFLRTAVGFVVCCAENLGRFLNYNKAKGGEEVGGHHYRGIMKRSRTRRGGDERIKKTPRVVGGLF